MRQIVAGNYPFNKRVISADEARQVFADQPYKLELIDGLEHGGLDEHGNVLTEKPEISLYTHDKFTDLCRGPHVERTGQINPSVSYTHLRAHETVLDLVCRLLLEQKK